MEEGKMNSWVTFYIGWQDGREQKKHFSAREVLHRWPDWPSEFVDCYLNGNDDGAENDWSRVYDILTNISALAAFNKAASAERLREVQ